MRGRIETCGELVADLAALIGQPLRLRPVRNTGESVTRYAVTDRSGADIAGPISLAELERQLRFARAMAYGASSGGNLCPACPRRDRGGTLSTLPMEIGG